MNSLFGDATYEEAKNYLLLDFASHYALKEAIKIFDNLDIEDARANSQILAELMKLRSTEAFNKHFGKS